MKKALDVVGAAQYDKGDHDDLVEEITDLIAHIEADRVDTVRKKLGDLLKDMTKFETEAILYNHLNAAKLALDKADDFDAEDLAPKTFERAENHLNELQVILKQIPVTVKM